MLQEKILVVDDEESINKLVCSYIKNENYKSFSAYTGKEALSLIKKENPDLIILDIMLPDIDGTSLCLDIRRISNAPIIFLSCKTQEIDKIIGLSAGGDDYITKPFAPGELIARIKAHLRRQHSVKIPVVNFSNKGIYDFGDLIIDLNACEVCIENEIINMTRKEFEILRLLAENPRKVFSASQIYESVWQTNCLESDKRTVMVYISTLRKKLEKKPDSPEYIVSVRGIGYKFNQTFAKNSQFPDKE